MESLTLDEFEREADTFDAAVYATPEIDAFCSSQDWILPACATWAPDLGQLFLRGDHGYAALLRHDDEEEGVSGWLGCDTMWGFACPIVGPEPCPLAEEFAAECLRRRDDWDLLVLTGMPEDGTLFHCLIEEFAPRFELRRGTVARRWVASLEGGLDGYLSRRRAKLRSNLRRAQRRAADAGIAVEEADTSDAAAVFDRILAIEARSWKGAEGTGLFSGDMQAFYRRIAERLAPRGLLRVLFARRDAGDVAYILGAVRGGTYRGFQFSFDRACRGLSLGSLLQLEQIERLCEQGIETYDLGIDLPYKQRWADHPFDTTTLLVM